MLEEHKAKKLAETRRKALAEWEGRRAEAVELLELAQSFKGSASDNIMLAAGEAMFYEVTGAALIEERRGAGHYEGRSQGVSIPVGSIGGRSVRYRVGASKGHYVQGAPTSTPIDTGTAVITNKRVIFQGTKQTRECTFAKLIGFQHDDVGGSTTFSVSNRQKPTTIHYGADLAGPFDFRLDLALAHFRGTVDDLVSQLEHDVANLDEERPPEPEPPVSLPAPPQSRQEAVPAPAPMAPPAPVQQPAVPPGWYADPWSISPLRWWDGSTWTAHVSEPPPPSPQ
jgi:hypothetical protein